MTWFKVDDTFHSHAKRYDAGLRAVGLWAAAGSWSGSHLTNGFIPRSVLPMLGGQPKDARALVESGLWSEIEGGFQFHDWEQYNPSKDKVEADREAARIRQQQARERKAAEAVTRNNSNHVTRDSQ